MILYERYHDVREIECSCSTSEVMFPHPLFDCDSVEKKFYAFTARLNWLMKTHHQINDERREQMVEILPLKQI